MSLPRKARKGRRGCYGCGAPSEVTIQVWMREYLASRDKGGNRRQRSVKSINVSMCRACGEAFYERAANGVPACPPEPKQTYDMSHARAVNHNSGWDTSMT